VHWEADKERLREEINNMVRSIAAGVPPESLAPVIQEKEAEVKQLEQRLRFPRKPRPDIEKLKAAVEQRAEEWNSDLRAEPKVGRMILRRLIGPINLFVYPPPEFIKEGDLRGLEHLPQIGLPKSSPRKCSADFTT
jgi:hypothetical protein